MAKSMAHKQEMGLAPGAAKGYGDAGKKTAAGKSASQDYKGSNKMKVVAKKKK